MDVDLTIIPLHNKQSTSPSSAGIVMVCPDGAAREAGRCLDVDGYGALRADADP